MYAQKNIIPTIKWKYTAMHVDTIAENSALYFFHVI